MICKLSKVDSNNKQHFILFNTWQNNALKNTVLVMSLSENNFKKMGNVGTKNHDFIFSTSVQWIWKQQMLENSSLRNTAKRKKELSIDLDDFSLSERQENDYNVTTISRAWYNTWYPVATKTIKTLKMYYPTIQFCYLYWYHLLLAWIETYKIILIMD